jgi:hypothetical protein
MDTDMVTTMGITEAMLLDMLPETGITGTGMFITTVTRVLAVRM